ncbi:MAG TPA: hypothetical protein VL400_27455, partial [Polyangiaceae bacterium]|nr:hypothetical protein [Polyangiaceae bacterium]
GGAGGLVPAFVLQGHMGRTALSCDDGHSIVADQSADDTVQCWGDADGLPDCDHSEWAGRGLAYGDGQFVATFGWGHPGTLRRSTDGVNWEDLITSAPNFADVAFGAGRFVANASPVKTSTNGIDWSDGGDLGMTVGNVRAIGFVPHAGGLFVSTGETGDQRDIVMSADGATWTHPSSRPAECGQYVRNVTYGAGKIAIFSGAGTVCTSSDGGDTWTLATIAASLSSNGIWTGTELMVWDGGTRYRSADGSEWQSEAISPSSARIGAVARSDAGTFLATHDSWLGWYDEQKFYRSTDGLTWEALPAGSFVGGHPINFIEFGWVAPSDACPAR